MGFVLAEEWSMSSTIVCVCVCVCVCVRAQMCDQRLEHWRIVGTHLVLSVCIYIYRPKRGNVDVIK